MTEYEPDPRRPAPTDAEPSQPELSRAEYARSDSPSTDRPDADPTVEAPTVPVRAVDPSSGGPDAAPSRPAPAAAGSTPAAQPVSGQPSWAPTGGHQHQHPYQPGARYPANPWYPGQPAWSGQPTGPGVAQSGYPGQAGGTPGGYPGQPGTQGGYPGQPAPWAPTPSSGPRLGKIAKLAGAGVAVFALMLGSGVAGGALTLALSDGGGITRTYSAAPVIDGADLPRIAASVQDSVVSISTGSGEGSGVVLSADGYVLTNNHVIAGGGDTVRVFFADGTSTQAEVVGTDPKTDLAVLKANGLTDLQPATLGDSDAMQVGDQVLALGSPLGLQGSVTAGILSARDRTIQAGGGQQLPGQAVSSISGLLQTDAPINPGNSGGALVNTRGEVIGINTAIATAGQGNTGNIGVGFAIPSNKAKDVAEKLQRGEKISHPSLGVSVNAAPDGGALIGAVNPGSAAERAGLQQGDVITRFGDKVINDSSDLVAAVQAGKVGDQVEVTYQRNGAEATATVTLAEAS
ncbi:PDZ domain-containing protein [Verrucosispora sp. CWR15]|uniref:PDZ domain-containing protein n=1 Tax=Verrucosispora sioxanthis TaxID=2499994 RepID=A0A6M1L7H1_9ACTN|nr:trypsin-like peptidase domain-containing protein [Verrucosispora sioxanthis]NEE64663.1 PDZ domain-containing protein [Verrucosispora sioxanthis]NGM13773.1 PDZ domain-containing protein [Verrucosispora sioxanthis]